MLKQALQQKLLQKLSPQQIQVIKLLEIPTIELEQRIKKEIEENPALEEGQEEEEYEKDEIEDPNSDDNISSDEREENEFSFEDYVEEDDTPSYKLNTSNYSKDDEKRDIPYSETSTFYELLKSQLGLKKLSEKQIVLAEYILGNIDEDGYLRRELNSIADDIAFSQNIQTNEEELNEILEIIQDLDPAGVGARNLQECLLLQIKRKDQTNNIKLAIEILENCFTEFTKKHYDKITKRLNITENQLKSAIDDILKLSPKPGDSVSDSNKNIQTIIPDFILDYTDETFQLSINSKNAPDLYINPTYTKMFHSYESNKKINTKNQKETFLFVKQKLDSARWFIDAIKQRQNTMLLTMNAIIRFQEEYFKEGDESKLRPMILKDIADLTKLDISTISRVSNSKYIQTHFGIYPLKYFFSEGLQTDSGEEVSTKEIKMILMECIEKEDKKRPLTDDKLAKILNKKGYQIARRTVAKYREQLNIPVGRLRKEI